MDPRVSPLVNWTTLEGRYPNYVDIDDLTVSSSDRKVQ